MAKPFLNDEAVEEILRDWLEKPKDRARELMERYGLPHEGCSNVLIWRSQGPFKRIVLHNEETAHHFPWPHLDMLEQVIDYRVPSDKVNDLLSFDGSLIVDRTRGELSSRCQDEAMNTIALNLADDIVKGRRSVEDARELYAQYAEAVRLDQPSEYAERLQFTPKEGPDPDREVKSPSRMEMSRENLTEVVDNLRNVFEDGIGEK